MSRPSERHRSWARWGWLVAVIFGVALLGGCEPPASPTEAPRQYDQLVRRALAQSKAQADSSLFWLRNTGNARARSLMLDLGVDYLRYNRGDDVLCVWSGEGLWPARGYATAPAAETALTDSIGTLCNIEGTCTVEPTTMRWARFECE
ncbi:MAG: hypothetical protein ABEL97_14655 [Salinibacter sp.]